MGLASPAFQPKNGTAITIVNQSQPVPTRILHRRRSNFETEKGNIANAPKITVLSPSKNAVASFTPSLAPRETSFGQALNLCLARGTEIWHPMARPSGGLIMYSGIANTNRPHFLNGWKEIANYLGKGVRTVQRYERNFRLPVRRPSGRSEGAVMATPAEIDAWLSAGTTPQVLAPAPLGLEREELRRNIARMAQLRGQLQTASSELRTHLSRLKQVSLQAGEVLQRISESAPDDLLRSPVRRKLNCPSLVESNHALTSNTGVPTRTGTETGFEIGNTARAGTTRSGPLPAHGQARKSA